MGTDLLGQVSHYIIGFLMIVPALTMHEWAHAYAAWRMGDDTARMMGRLSLNPLRHIDPIGTVAIPIFLLLFTGGRFSFGYAKPVPINPRNFKDYRKGVLITGIAGPLMNIALGVGCALLVRGGMAASTLPGVEELLVRGGLTSAFSVALTTIYTFAFMNFILAFFNLIPIPPLDGSRVLQRFLHGRARQWYAQIERYGFFIVLALLWGGELWGVDLLQGYFAWTVEPLMRFFSGVMS